MRLSTGLSNSRQPASFVGVAQSNPLTKQLHWALGSYTGSNAFWNPVNRTLASFYQSGGNFAQKWVPRHSAKGHGVVISNSGVGGTVMTFGDSAGSATPTSVASGTGGTKWTMAWGLNLPAAPTSTCNLFDGNGGAYQILIRILSDLTVQLVWPGVAVIFTTSALPTNTDGVLVVNYDSVAGTGAAYWNGVQIGSGGFGDVNWNKAQGYIYDWWCNGTVVWGAAAWRRILTIPEIKSFTQNPWQLFQAPSRPIWVPSSSGTNTYTITPSGSVAFSGASALLRTRAFAPSGSIAFSGVASAIRERAIIPTGLVTFSGTAPITFNAPNIYTILPTGSIAFLGTAPNIRERVVVPAGEITFGGTSPQIRTRITTPSGQVIFSGTSPLIFIPAGGIPSGDVNRISVGVSRAVGMS